MEWNAEEQPTYPTVIWILLVTFFIQLKETNKYLSISISKWVAACGRHGHAMSPFFIRRVTVNNLREGLHVPRSQRDDKQVNKSHTSVTFMVHFPSPCSCTTATTSDTIPLSTVVDYEREWMSTFSTSCITTVHQSLVLHCSNLQLPNLECSNHQGQTRCCLFGWSGWNNQQLIH